MLNGSKFFGYTDSERCNLLLDISEFGLTASVKPALGNANAISAGPRFYMKYLDEIWFVLLIPGKREGVMGLSPKVEPKFDDDDKEEVENVKEADHNDGEDEQNAEEEGEAGDEEDEDEDEEDEEEDFDYTHTKEEEIAMAQAFDAKLDQEVGRPGIMLILDFTKKLGCWTASTLKSSLEGAQFADAMMTLPFGRPAQSAYLKNALSCLFK